MPIDASCLTCGHELKGVPDKFKGKTGSCPKCKAPVNFPDGLSAPEPRTNTMLPRRGLLSGKSSLIVTTTPAVDGYRIDEYLGVESVEYVLGTGLFSEVATGVQDVFGGRSTGFEKKLAEAKTDAMRSIRAKAATAGANAIVGVDLDYVTFSSNRVALVVSGTFVKVSKLG